MSGSVRLSLAGFFAIAVAFGPARNGYGLFLPEIRNEFALSTEALGLVASGAYAGYLLALSATGLLAGRFGPRMPVVAGGLSAASGMVMVAFSPNAAVLVLGVVLAATSAGFSWAPYNDAAERMIPEGLRGRVLSIVSTGTTFGIAASGLLALAAGLSGFSWRAAWVAFAAAGLATAAWNALVLPGATGDARSFGRGFGPRGFLRAEAAPLFAIALSFGLTSSIYWAFAVDHVSRASDVPSGYSGSLFFVVIGVAGFAGLLTGDTEKRFGIRRVLPLILFSLAASLSMLGAAPNSWPSVMASAALFGACVMTISALLAFWSSRVFPERPSAGFTAALLLFALGSIAGPALAGIFAARFGLGTVFVASGCVALLTALVSPREGKAYAREAAGDP